MKLLGKILLVWVIFAVGFYGIDQASWMFNHPWFVGEDAVAVLIAFVIGFLTLTVVRLILFPKPVTVLKEGLKEGHD